MTLLAHKIELRPTDGQVDYLNRACGHKRHCYNQLLEHFKQDGMKWSKAEAYQYYRKLRINFSWYAEVSFQITRCAIDDLDAAFKHFFRRARSKKGKPGFPRFKKSGINDSFALRDRVRFDIDERELRIERLKTRVKMRQKLRFDGVSKRITISKKAGRFFVSILVETDDYQTHSDEREPSSIVGVDLGIKDLAVLSDGMIFSANQKLKVQLCRLKKLQRRLRRKQKGSNRRKKAVAQIAELHYFVANQRKATLHELTDYLTRNFQTIVIEDLNVSGMVKNHKLARSISDVGFGMFKEFLGYKADLRGNDVIKADRFFPSSKMCSACGFVMSELPLSIREWVCPSCGVVHDRDLNASFNLESYGRQMLPADLNCTQELCKTPDLSGATALTA